MRTVDAVIALVSASACATSLWAAQAQDRPTNVMPGAAEAGECAQAQLVVDKLLDAAGARLEAARQSNSPAAMRAAIEDLQSAMRDMRVQLAPCAKLAESADPHAAHAMPGMPPSSAGTAPAPGAPMDHSKMPMGTTPGAKPPASPGAKPPVAPAAPMDHSKMPMGTAPGAKPPASSSAKPPAAPAPMDHSKMPMGSGAATRPAPTQGAKPPTAAAPMDHSKMTMDTTKADSAAQATDPVCGLKVDTSIAPQAANRGQTYYFCSEQHRQLFQKNPTKYLPKGQ